MAKAGPEYLQQEIKIRISQHLLRFKLYAQLAEDGDKTEDPSTAWPAARKKILLGIIEIKKLANNTTAGDKALSFFPNNIADGIETADPMLDFRSKAYPISVKGRQ